MCCLVCALLLLGLAGVLLNVDFVPQAKANPELLEPEIIGFSTATNGTSCTFRVKWNATGSYFIFGTNNTGSWENETAQACSGTWTNATKTLNETANIIVQWRIWANDTNGDWTSIPLQSLTTVLVYSKGAVTGSASDIDGTVDDVAAQGGGNVYVPAGIFDWYSTQVSFSHDNIKIIGAGIDVTYINQTKSCPFNRMFYINDCENVTIRDLTLKGLVTGGDSGDGTGIYFWRVIDFRVCYCKFIDFPEAAIYVRTSGVTYPCRGVVDHCSIFNPYKHTVGGSWAYGISIKSNDYSPNLWDTDITHFLGKYETANDTHPIVYVEDCVMNDTRHALASNQLGWYVVRYCTLIQDNANSVIDVHGGSTGVCGGRGLELYNNTIDHDGAAGGYGVGLRGGSGTIFNNTIKNINTGILLTNDSIGDPHPLSDVWIWNNTFQNVNTNYDIKPWYTEDEDYFMRAPNMEQDGFTYTPYPYPHPLTLEEGGPQNTWTSYNTTHAGATCEFKAGWFAPRGLSHGILSHNKTGSWANETAVSLSGTTNVFVDTITLPNQSGVVFGYRFYANDTTGEWGSTSILTFVVGQESPTNDACTITNMDDTDNLYAQKKWYTIDYDVSDPDGYADIDYAEVRLKQITLLRASFRYDEDTNIFSIQSGSDKWDLDTSGSTATESSTYINMTFKVMPQWDALEESSLEIECYVVDDQPENDTDTMQTNYFDVVTNLVVSNFACDDDRGNLGQTITFTGGVYYASDPEQTTPSTYYPSPPYAEFNKVEIHDASHTVKGTDTTIVDGQFSVSFSAESTVGITTYHSYVDMTDTDYTDGDESPTDTFIADRLDCWSVTDNTGDHRINVGGTFEIRYKIQYDYDDTEFTSSHGSVSGFTWDSGNGWWDKTVTGSSSVTSTNYDETYISVSETTYGITTKKDVAGVNIITDRIKVLTVTANKTSPNVGETVELRVTAMLEYDSHPVASGDTVTLETLSMTWDSGDSRWEATDSKATAQTVTYDTVTGSEATYGITSVYMNGKSVSVTWGAPAPPELIEWTLPSDTHVQNLLAGDLLAFITGIYTLNIGQLFYAILILLFTIPLYIRTHSFLFVSIVWMLIGGALMVAMPIVGSVAVFFLSVGLAGMFWKLFTTIR